MEEKIYVDGLEKTVYVIEKIEQNGRHLLDMQADIVEKIEKIPRLKTRRTGWYHYEISDIMNGETVGSIGPKFVFVYDKFYEKLIGVKNGL